MGKTWRMPGIVLTEHPQAANHLFKEIRTSRACRPVDPAGVPISNLVIVARYR